MLGLRWMIGGVLLAPTLFLIGANSWIFWKGMLKRERTPSWTPLMGGIFGALALIIIPVDALHRMWRIPFLLDWGSLPGITYTLLWHLWRKARPAPKSD